MTVKQLKAYLTDIPDDAQVLIGDEDCGNNVNAYLVYYAFDKMRYEWRFVRSRGTEDKSKVKAVEITGLF